MRRVVLSQRVRRVALNRTKNAISQVQPKVANQRMFRGLNDFRKHSDNFILFFMRGNEIYRKRPVFRRFAKRFPKLEVEITESITKITREPIVTLEPRMNQMPWEKLFDAYNKMSRLLYRSDAYVVIKTGSLKGRVDIQHLTR